MRLCLFSIFTAICFAPISVTGADPCDLPVLQVYCLEKELLLIHKNAPRELKQGLLIQFQRHLDRASKQIQSEHKDPVYAIYEDVRSEFGLHDFEGGHHHELRKSFGQTSFGEAVDDFVRRFDQDPSLRGRREETRNFLKKLGRLLKDPRKHQRDIDRFYCKLRSWIDGWAPGLDPNDFKDSIDVIKDVVATPEIGEASKVNCKLMDGVSQFIERVVKHCQGQHIPQDSVRMLMALNQYIDALRESKMPEIKRIEDQMKARFSFVRRRVGPEQLTRKCEGQPAGRVGLEGAQLVSVYHQDRNSTQWYPPLLLPPQSNVSFDLFLFPETKLILRYNMMPVDSAAFVIIHNLTMNDPGSLISPVLPKETLPERIYVTTESLAYVVDQKPWSVCRLVERLQRYCKGELRLDPNRQEKEAAILTLWKQSELATIQPVKDKGFEDNWGNMEEGMNKVQKDCNALQLFFLERNASIETFREVISENLLAKYKKQGDPPNENLPTEELLESLRELVQAGVDQVSFASKSFMNNEYQADPAGLDRIHVMTVVPMIEQ